MSIEQIVQQAIEEFGECAYERFVLIALGFGEQNKNNETLLHILEYDNHLQHHSIELKPLPELFAHDKSFYINAFEMWEFSTKFNTDLFIAYSCNKNVIDWMKKYPTRRKTSAALPFDLERAKAGDAVECLYHRKHQVLQCTLTDKLGIIKNGIAVCCDGELFIAQERELRMKYPKKAAI